MYKKIVEMSRNKMKIKSNQSNSNYDVGNEIIYNIEVFQNLIFAITMDAYFLVRGNIKIIGHNVTQVVFKNILSVLFTPYAPFTKCITSSDGTTVDNA